MSGAAQVAVMGAGAWGTALAQALASDGTPVLLWAREPALAQEINQARTNTPYLPGVHLAGTIRATADIAELAGAGVVLAVVPAQYLGAALAALPAYTGAGQRDLVLCAKGIERGTGRLMLDVAREAVPDAALAVLSGPTFAREVALGLPTAVTLACAGGEAQWQRLAPVIARGHLRP